MKIRAIIVILLSLLLVQCNYEPREEEVDQREHIRIIYPNWTEGIALANLIKIILTDYLHYNVILKMDDIEDIYANVASGDYDVFPDAWLPHTHAGYWEKYGDSIHDIGILFPQARTGILAPDYMEIDSLGQLKLLDPDSIIIHGIDSFAGVMQSARKAAKHYDFRLNIRESNEETMIQNLEQAYLKRQDILITGWEPHWVFSRYNLKFLKDPDSIFGGYEQIHILGRNNIVSDYPNLGLFLHRISLSDKQMNALLNEMEVSGNFPERGVKKWIDDNIATVNQWIHGLRVKRRYSM